MSVKYPYDIESKEIIILAELVKTHIEEVKRLWPNIRRAKGEFVVKCLGVSFDSFRQEVWVRDANLEMYKSDCILSGAMILPVYIQYLQGRD